MWHESKRSALGAGGPVMLVGLYPLHQHHPTNHPWWSPLSDSQLVLVRLPHLLLLVACLLDQVGTCQRSQQRGLQCSGV